MKNLKSCNIFGVTIDAEKLIAEDYSCITDPFDYIAFNIDFNKPEAAEVFEVCLSRYNIHVVNFDGQKKYIMVDSCGMFWSFTYEKIVNKLYNERVIYKFLKSCFEDEILDKLKQAGVLSQAEQLVQKLK